MINRYLSLISGLRVVVTETATQGAQYEFSDSRTKVCLHTCFTYKKAKQFARGVQIGRLLSKCET